MESNGRRLVWLIENLQRIQLWAEMAWLSFKLDRKLGWPWRKAFWRALTPGTEKPMLPCCEETCEVCRPVATALMDHELKEHIGEPYP